MASYLHLHIVAERDVSRAAHAAGFSGFRVDSHVPFNCLSKVSKASLAPTLFVGGDGKERVWSLAWS